MLFRGPMGGGAASGKMGAMVAARNKGGQYLRARAVPSGRVASEFQQVIRNALGTLVTRWNEALTPEQHAAWSVYASNVLVTNRLGDAIQLSGQNWFIACNTPRLQVALPVVDDAPIIFNRGTVLIPDLVASATGTTLTLDFGGTVTADATLLVYQGKPFSQGRAKYYGSRRLVGSIDLSTGGSGGHFTPAFPLPGSVSQQEVSVVITSDDGRLSTPLGTTFPG